MERSNSHQAPFLPGAGVFLLREDGANIDQSLPVGDDGVVAAGPARRAPEVDQVRSGQVRSGQVSGAPVALLRVLLTAAGRVTVVVGRPGVSREY